jgi:nickel-dependent lactate racemase
MNVLLGYHKDKIEVSIPDQNLKGILKPRKTSVDLSEHEILAYALTHPIGAPLLSDLVKSGEKVVIVTSDITRPMPTAKVLPRVVETLNHAGIQDQDITVVFGLGVTRRKSRQPWLVKNCMPELHVSTATGRYRDCHARRVSERYKSVSGAKSPG